MQMIECEDLEHIIEAILFVSGEPVSIKKLSEITLMEEIRVEIRMDKFIKEYNGAKRGTKMIKLESSYQLITRAEYYEYIARFAEHKLKQPLSPSALEVLSVIAYNQPITRTYIEKVRGMDSVNPVNKLLERDLIEQKGRLDSPGRPILYGTTDEFLRCFGLSSLSELPNLDLQNDDSYEPNYNLSFDDLENTESDDSIKIT